MNAELPVERLEALAADALELARRSGNIAQLHRSRGEDREAVYAQQAEASMRRYAEILTERGRDARQAAKVAGA
jgi:hypothetical protein